MPTYDVSIPGKGTFTVNSPEDLTDEQAYYAVMQQLRAEAAPKEPEPQPQTGFVPNVRAGVERLKGDYYAFLAGMGQPGAAEEAERYRQKAAQIATVPEFTDKPFEFLKSVAGGSVPYMAAPLAAGLAATPLGVPAAIGASGLASAAQFTGSNLARQLEEGTAPEQLGMGKAAAAAVPQAALDVVGFRYIPGIRKIFGSAGVQIGNKEAAGIVEKYITPAFKAAGVEGGTEAAQQVLERMQAGLSITDPEARKEYFDSFVAGAVLGGALSVPGSMLERPGVAPPEPPPPPGAPTTEEPAAPPTAAAPEVPALPQLPAPERGIPLGYTPTKALPAPPEKVDIYKLMDSHDTLKSSLDPLADQIYKARQEGDTETARTLMQEYRDNEAAMNALATRITEAGGVLESSEEAEAAYNKQLKTLDSEIAEKQNIITEMSRPDVRDYDAVNKAEKRLAKLQAERDAAEEEFQRKRGVLRVKETPPGEQISLFDTEEQKPKAEEVLKFKTESGQEFTGPELERMAQGPVRSDQAYLSQQAKVAVDQRGKVLEKYQEDLAALANKDTRQMDAYARNSHDEQMHQALMKVRQLENEIAALTQGQSLAALKEAKNESFGADSLFGNFNLLNTAIQNQDQRTIDRIAELRRKADLAAFGHQHYKISPREEVYQMLKDRIGGILRRERNYDSYEATVNDKRVEIYVSDAIAKEITDLRRKVEAPRTRTVNGKKVPVRSMLQMLYDYHDDYNVRVAKLEKAKADKADKKTIAAKKAAVERAREKYQKQFDAVMVERNKLDALLRGLYKTTGEFAPAPGTKGEPTIKTPRQKQEELEKLGTSERETSRPVKTAANVRAGKVKISEAKVAQELGETMDEYQSFAAPYQKRLQAKVDQYNKFIAGANERLTKLKEKYIDAAEVAAVEQQLKAARAALKDVPDENPIEKDKAQKKVNSLEAQLVNVKIPKEEKYKIAEANLVKIAKERLDELNKLKNELTKLVGAKAVELGKQHPDFKKKLAEAKEKYQDALQDSVQEVKNLRTPQVTRKLPKLKETRTASEESRAETQRRQTAFESELSEEKGRAYDYQQREEARERTLKARQAKEAKGTAMQVAMTKAAQEKVITEVEAREKEQGKFARGVEVESPDLTAAQIKMLEDNNLTGVLRGIADDKNASDLNRVIAARLAAMLDETNVELADKLYDSEGKEVLGEAISTNIKLSRAGGLSQEVLLHEATHAAVERVIQMPDSMLTKEQVIAKRELLAMYNSIKNDPNITSANAKSSLSEFAAEVFSNRNLQEQLRKKKWRGSNMWEGLKSVILRMLGVKVPDTMLGAALKSVDLLMIPSSAKIGRAEKPVSRQYSAKDIAALDTGSNSMRVFAEQFGPEIKQKDRTPEDVERLAAGYLIMMNVSPEDYIAYSDWGEVKWGSFTRMPNGKQYNENSVDDFFTADPQVISYASMDPSDFMQLVKDVNEKRESDIGDLMTYLRQNPDYTLVEQALVAKAATKYGVVADKNGQLKAVTIGKDNLHPVAVVGHDSANAIIEELRAGKSLKDAFIDGLQKRANRNKELNLGKQGWKKFNQIKPNTNAREAQDAAVALNAGAAGTSWCTGRDVGTAKSQLEDGDFYIYYDDGVPEVAIRMQGDSVIGEIRGSTPTQALSDAQQKIATAFLKKRNFAGSDQYMTDVEFRTVMLDAIKTGKTLTPEQTMRFFSNAESFTKNRMADVLAYENDRITTGFLANSEVLGNGVVVSSDVAKEVDMVFARSAINAYANGYFFMDDLALVFGANAKDGVLVAEVPAPYISREQVKAINDKFKKDAQEAAIAAVERGKNVAGINGKALILNSKESPEQQAKRVYDALLAVHKDYPKAGNYVRFVTPLKDIKALAELGFTALSDVELDSVERINRLQLGDTNNALILPKTKNINVLTITGKNVRTPILSVKDDTYIGSVGADKENRSAVLAGDAYIKRLILTDPVSTLDLVAPDITRIGVIENEPNLRYAQQGTTKALVTIMPQEALSVKRFVTLRKDGSPAVEDAQTAEGIRSFGQDGFDMIAEPMSKLAKALYKLMTPDETARFRDFFDRRIQSQLRYDEKNVGLDAEDFLHVQVSTLLRNRDVAEVNKNIEKIKNALAALGVSKENLARIEPVQVGELTAPDLKQVEDVVDDEFVEIPERPRYAPKNIGVREEKPGVFSFKSYVQPGATPSSIVADEPRTVDTLKANFLGIAGRVQFVDKFAAISEAFKKGMDAKKISQLEASNGEYYLRFGENRSQYAQQALTNGPLSRVVSRETPEGKEYIYRSDAGANLLRVFQILEKSGIKNSTELDRMFTVYQAGKRAKQVGWEKLWVGNPAKAKAEYDAVMAQLNSNPQMRDAFEAASAEYKAFNNGLVDFLVQTGAMTQDQANKLKSIDYVPYYRVNKGSGDVELFTDKEVPIRIGNIKDEPQLQQLVGDNTQILPLSVSSVQNAFMLVDMGLRNQRVKDTSFLLHKIGFAKTLAKGEGPANRDTVRFKVKGEPYYAIIDTDLYGIPADLIVKGMEGIKTSLPMAVKAMGVPADILRKFVTRNPAYAIRQAIRDPLTAWMTTGTDGVPIFNSFKQLSSMVAGRSETERKLMETGAISSNVFTGGPEDFKRFLRDISAGKSGWEKLMAKADAFAMQGDAATRAVVYEDSIAKGLSEQQALLRTLESMNFGRRGLSPTMYYLNTLIPFFNAQIQGLDVLYRAFTNKMPYSEQLKIREKLIARGLLMGAATLAYAAMMQDDEAYKRAKPEERLANWFVYIPGMDQPLKVPIPFELGYLFKSLPEAVFNMGAADERSQDITKGMGKLVKMSNPFALPQAVKPVTELYLGKSFFGGDIESQREQKNMLPTERFRSTTTELSKVLGGATGDAGITPIGWDHLIRGYTGGLGIALVSLANPILNTEATMVEKPSKKLHETPFIGGLFQPVEGRGTLDAAYERMLEIQQAKGTFNQLMQQGKREEAQAFLDAYRNKVVAASLSGTMQQRLGELATMRRRIVEMPNMPQEKKDEILERIDDQQIMLARRFLEATNETKPQADRP